MTKIHSGNHCIHVCMLSPLDEFNSPGVELVKVVRGKVDLAWLVACSRARENECKNSSEWASLPAEWASEWASLPAERHTHTYDGSIAALQLYCLHAMIVYA